MEKIKKILDSIAWFFLISFIVFVSVIAVFSAMIVIYIQQQFSNFNKYRRVL